MWPAVARSRLGKTCSWGGGGGGSGRLEKGMGSQALVDKPASSGVATRVSWAFVSRYESISHRFYPHSHYNISGEGTGS